jgi:FAD:protein FMN transferase
LNSITLKKNSTGYVGTFQAMASPCELLIETDNEDDALAVTHIASCEAWRIEKLFSRYRHDNLIHKINTSQGKPVKVDDELGRLLDFSEQCYAISGGLFDITSGVLRHIWKFDGSDNIPSRKQAKALLPYIGWDKVKWEKPWLTLQTGMEIDLGGIGKEYAVDRTALLITKEYTFPVLINFGGDLYATKKPKNRSHWQIGIDPTTKDKCGNVVSLIQGGLTTSGDAQRYLLRHGQRYSHALNPRTAWPVNNAPRSVTVIANNCIDAGFISTLALLQGKGAKEFLKGQNVRFWVD